MKTKKKKPIRYYSPKRRAVYARGDNIDALLLFDLHGWICYLCREKIDKKYRCPDWRAATIEHVVPLASGGTHTWDNVVPAHLKCNLNKSDLSLDQSKDILGKWSSSGLFIYREAIIIS